jgi:hypothetical protein
MIIAELWAIPSSFKNQNCHNHKKKKIEKQIATIKYQTHLQNWQWSQKKKEKKKEGITTMKIEFSGRRKLPVANALAARALLGGGIVAVGADGVVVGENAGHWGAMWRLSSSSRFKIGVDLKVLGGRVLHQMEQSHGNYENRQ